MQEKTGNYFDFDKMMIGSMVYESLNLKFFIHFKKKCVHERRIESLT